MKIKVKFFDDNLYAGDNSLQKIGGKKSDWIDLRAAEDIVIEEGEYMLIPLGLAMELPDGYEAHICPRSSTFKYFGIIQTNSMGIVDNSYCGDNDQWKMPVYCLKGNSTNIEDGKRYTSISKGERICQFRIMPVQSELDFKVVSILGNKDRDGIGSSGTK